MNNTIIHTLDRDELYAAWSEDREATTPRLLKEWTSRYPQHTLNLTQWSVTESLLELTPEPMITPEMEAQSREIGRNVLAETRARYEATLPALASINATAKANGLSLNALAQSLGMSSRTMQTLDMRQARFETIPARLFTQIAAKLEVSAAQVRNYLQFNTATLAQGVAYKSNGVPQVGDPKDFADIIQSDMTMTDAQKAVWLAEDEEN